MNHYYPFGGLFGEGIQTLNQPYKYNGKELDRFQGLDLYDSGARHYDAVLGRWFTVDPLAEKYYPISPYVYAGNNPIRNIDINGDSITVLNMGYGENQHMAMLIQNQEGKWQYFSLNGDKIFNSTKGIFGGGPNDDLGTKEFNSPEEFMNSSFNKRAQNKEHKTNKDKINGYGFIEGYVLPTSPEQDDAIRKIFIKAVDDGYNLFWNQCSQAVQKSLNAGGIGTGEMRFLPSDSYSNSGGTYIESNPYLPSRAFNQIIRNNPYGYYIKKR